MFFRQFVCWAQVSWAIILATGWSHAVRRAPAKVPVCSAIACTYIWVVNINLWAFSLSNLAKIFVVWKAAGLFCKECQFCRISLESNVGHDDSRKPQQENQTFSTFRCLNWQQMSNHEDFWQMHTGKYQPRNYERLMSKERTIPHRHYGSPLYHNNVGYSQCSSLVKFLANKFCRTCYKKMREGFIKTQAQYRMMRQRKEYLKVGKFVLTLNFISKSHGDLVFSKRLFWRDIKAAVLTENWCRICQDSVSRNSYVSMKMFILSPVLLYCLPWQEMDSFVLVLYFHGSLPLEPFFHLPTQ